MIILKRFTGKALNINIQLNDTVDKLKTQIQAREGYATNVQNFLDAGKLILDNHRLIEYSI